MRIGIDIRCLAGGKRTGVEEYTVRLLEHLFSIDHENQYVLFLNSWSQPRADFSWLEKYANVELRLFRWPNKILNAFLWYIGWPYVDRWLGGTDIFFMPNLNFISLSCHTHLVLTAHDISFDLHPETFSLKRRLWHALVNFRSLVRRADRIVAVSETTRSDMLATYRVSSGKVAVVHSGVDARFHPFDRNDSELLRVKEKYQLPYKFILFFGTLEPRKNLSVLIRAFAAVVKSGHVDLEKYFLVVAGTAGWECEGMFSEIERSGVSDKIILTGFVDEADQAALYNLASLFVYPSVYEGFGFPPLEAMACGIPTIVSNVSVFPETVGAAGILIDPWNPEELFFAMREVLLDKQLQERLRTKGLKRAKDFDWEKTAKRMVRLWSKIKKDAARKR